MLGGKGAAADGGDPPTASRILSPHSVDVHNLSYVMQGCKIAVHVQFLYAPYVVRLMADAFFIWMKSFGPRGIRDHETARAGHAAARRATLACRVTSERSPVALAALGQHDTVLLARSL